MLTTLLTVPTTFAAGADLTSNSTSSPCQATNLAPVYNEYFQLLEQYPQLKKHPSTENPSADDFLSVGDKLFELKKYDAYIL